jgi:cytochrome c-type biogenesis protein CcmE
VNKTFVSLLILALIIAGSLLVYASFSGTTNVYMPSELEKLNEPKKRIRLVGRVQDKELIYKVEPEFLLSFYVGDPQKTTDKIPNKASIFVSYKGIKPDMFAPGRDVIIDGEYLDGKVLATNLLTQCPSKYEAPAPKE